MRALAAAALALGLASAAGAEMRDEEHIIGDRIVRITVFDTFEIMTVGPSEYDQMQVLSGADVELVPLAGAEDAALTRSKAPAPGAGAGSAEPRKPAAAAT